MANLSGSSLLAGITSGLTNTYSILAQQSATGVTLDSIASTRTNTSLTNVLNQSFASYMQTNFSTLDKDKDGVLGASELNAFTNSMANQGFTQAQLTQLGPASGMSGATLEKVLAHFNEIDANHDGKVTSAEISAYNYTSAAEKKRVEFANRSATNQSMFYGNDNASNSPDSSSMLAYKYLSDES